MFPHPLLVLFLLAYISIHSLLAARPVKAWFQRTWGTTSTRTYRLFYNAIAIITLLPLPLLQATLPDQTLYIVPAPWYWLLLCGQALALLGLCITLIQTDLFHFLGLRQLAQSTPTDEGPLVVRGFYAYVRHPLYSFALLLLWLSPIMTLNLLTIFLFWTFYIYIGSFHEEQRLHNTFGTAYQTYQQHVPRLVPRLQPYRQPQSAEES